MRFFIATRRRVLQELRRGSLQQRPPRHQVRVVHNVQPPGSAQHEPLPVYFPPLPLPPPPRRRLFGVIIATLFVSTASMIVGIGAGLSPAMLQPLERDSDMDLRLTEFVGNKLDEVPLVAALRAEPSWEEHQAYESLPASSRETLLTAGALGGSRGISKQLVFRNKDTNEAVSIVRLGPGVGGWPFMAHGGVTATLLDESLGRAAIMCLGDKPAVTANLNINYVAKVMLPQIIIIRSQPTAPPHGNKAFVSGSIKTVDGELLVEATGLFVVPKQFKLSAIPEGF